jgi:hypothetical protein
VNHHGDQRDHAEVDAEQQAGGQRVGHAALEDQVGVHQPVADDGPTERERQEDQAKGRQIRQPPRDQPRNGQVKQEGNGVEQREGPTASSAPRVSHFNCWRCSGVFASE